ncbi:D-alanine--poly(phosphoribitol) ligase subunit DltC [Paucilactobacillus suebicus]|uniref:D-alanyl carrier protein n=1 Tax=Paucilactobacillus suebicus DSM 5007 = KCTC 3549 TaxID=1423807 RepID=A0A0R1WBH8_9LACO|nr:D-alanine--poly(phosphoribitol) ligase subunit DltC [Paucilactobacillus suebicus]KRM12307.1 D-alanine--poly(phosphoribitol) ligase subunit 2 [Paucilactobacillus suebicus DSM 5007 = KCTC 3549]
MDAKETVMNVLKDITGTDLSDKMDENLFETGLIDSMATVELLLNLQDELGIDVPISEFDRQEWDTPNKIINKVESM